MSAADVLAAYPTDRVIIREIGLRDGLQLTRTWPSTAQKIEWIDKEFAAGIRYFEVGSFLPADKAPRFADTRDVIAGVARHENAHSIALALNKRGASDALQTPVNEITMVVSASKEHNEANTHRTQEQSLEEVKKIVQLRNEAKSNTIISAGISMSFGCSYSGPVHEDVTLRMVDQCMEAGVDMVALADTVGYAGPNQVSSLCTKMESHIGTIPYAIHLHDTRGLGLANAAAALNAGCRIVDASLAGLGGCPFAPGATGNIVIEDMIFLAETMGFSTGVNIEKVIEIREILKVAVPGETLHGAVAAAGVPETLNLQ